MHLRRGDEIIRLQDVTVDYGDRIVLRDVNLSVESGDFIAVTGPNGGGKTTLLRIILKLLKPNKGSVAYFSGGREVKNLRIGYLPQKSMIDVRFPITAGEVVKSGLLKGLRQKFSDAEKAAFARTVDMIGIGSYLDRPVGDLSGGQLQRTLMGRVLISDPDVVVLDEPLSYVDKQFEHQIYSIMEQIAEKSTVILVSHEMTYISAMASRHIIVDHELHECEGHHHYSLPDCK